MCAGKRNMCPRASPLIYSNEHVPTRVASHLLQRTCAHARRLSSTPTNMCPRASPLIYSNLCVSDHAITCLRCPGFCNGCVRAPWESVLADKLMLKLRLVRHFVEASALWPEGRAGNLQGIGRLLGGNAMCAEGSS